MHRLVVIGTGTGVGKTHLSCALIRALRVADPAATVMGLKPVETGIEGDAAVGSDAAQLEAASGRSATRPHPLYAFPDPLSPHLAARRDGRPPIELDAVAVWVREQENEMTRHVVPSRSALSLVETAGAVFSPLAAGVTNFDLARALEPAVWILVAPDALGVLHDVTVTLEALSARGRLPDHLLLSAAREDASTGTNAAELRGLGIAKPSAVLDRQGGGLEAFARSLIQSLG